MAMGEIIWLAGRRTDNRCGRCYSVRNNEVPLTARLHGSLLARVRWVLKPSQSCQPNVTIRGLPEMFRSTFYAEELHLSGLRWTASHPDIWGGDTRIIGFFFDNRLHWRFGVEKKIYQRLV